MNRKYYQEYYELERSHWWFIVREGIISDIVKQILRGPLEKTILNVGAAAGRSSEVLAKFGNVTSLEIDRSTLSLTTRHQKINLIQASVMCLPFKDSSFDLVCALDVIEHIASEEQAAIEMNRVCKVKGHILITAPAFKQLWSKHDEVNKHYRRHVLSEVTSLFSVLKGKVVRKTYFNFFLFLPILTFRMFSKIFPTFFRTGSGSDFSVFGKNKFLGNIFKSLFELERKSLHYLNFPFGVSLIFLWKKDK